MPRVKVEFFGPIRRPWPERRREVDLPEGSDVDTLLDKVGFEEKERGMLLVVVNGAKAVASRRLVDGDSVELMLQVGGG